MGGGHFRRTTKVAHPSKKKSIRRKMKKIRDTKMAHRYSSGELETVNNQMDDDIVIKEELFFEDSNEIETRGENIEIKEESEESKEESIKDDMLIENCVNMEEIKVKEEIFAWNSFEEAQEGTSNDTAGLVENHLSFDAHQKNRSSHSPESRREKILKSGKQIPEDFVLTYVLNSGDYLIFKKCEYPSLVEVGSKIIMQESEVIALKFGTKESLEDIRKIHISNNTRTKVPETIVCEPEVPELKDCESIESSTEDQSHPETEASTIKQERTVFGDSELLALMEAPIDSGDEDDFVLRDKCDSEEKLEGEDCSITQIVPGYSRKRAKQKETWKTVEVKKKRNSGAEYISRHTKLVVPARHISECICNCQCYQKVGYLNIQAIFKAFWDLGDYDLQNAYLIKCATSRGVKRTYVKDRPSRTSRRIEYSVTVNDQKHIVCRKAFYCMHAVSEKRVRSAIKKTTPYGTVIPDQRGKKEPGNKVNHNNFLWFM